MAVGGHFALHVKSAGVVDQHIEPVIALAKLSSDPAHLRLHRQISHQKVNVRVTRLPTNAFGDSRTLGRIAPHANNGGAHARQFQRGDFANASGSAGDKNCFTLHVLLLP